MGIGIVGGTGVDTSKFIENSRLCVSSGRQYNAGNVGPIDVLTMSRHAGGTPPHLIDHVGTIKVMRNNGAQAIIAITACGSLDVNLAPGTFVVPYDFVDFTRCNQTALDEIVHPIANPSFDPDLRKALMESLDASEVGPIVSIRGPRFATRAESTFYALQGWDLINMTTGPEASIALELGIPYAIVGFVTDYDSGANTDEPPATYEQIKERFQGAHSKLEENLPKAIKLIDVILKGRKRGS
jgi:5'-methylthioadenosine phosphorylase